MWYNKYCCKLLGVYTRASLHGCTHRAFVEVCMAKDLDTAILFDIYEPLLTDKQRDTLDLYYNEDLSLGEIADNSGVSRQAVMNCINKTDKRLAELEELLGLQRKSKRASELLALLSEHTDGSTAAAELIQELEQLL